MDYMARLVGSGDWSMHDWSSDISSASDGNDARCNELQNYHLELSLGTELSQEFLLTNLNIFNWFGGFNRAR